MSNLYRMIIAMLLFFELSIEGYSYSQVGEPCSNSDECNDHRLMCNGYENSSGICVCDKYHKLMNNTECVQMYNTSSIMETEITGRDTSDLATIIENYNENVFYVQSMAGIFVASVCALTIAIVMIYCYFVRRSDRALKISTKSLLNSKCEQSNSGVVKIV